MVSPHTATTVIAPGVNELMKCWRRGYRIVFVAVAISLCQWSAAPIPAGASETLIIATSPSVAAPIQALGRAFEARHPEVRVGLYIDSGLELRQTIAAIEKNASGKYFIGTGPIHLVAPGGDELITRLEQKYYVLPGTRRQYAAVPLVLVVPEALVEAPDSFEALGEGQGRRVAIADPALTTLGQQSRELLIGLGLWDRLTGQLDIAGDVQGVLDHVLNGQAEVGIVFGPDAVKESQRIRVASVADGRSVHSTVHSIAMERYCPNRRLCEEFLHYTQSSEAQALLSRLGYAPVSGRLNEGVAR
jgi:molybdate transport system substrate-binding protein